MPHPPTVATFPRDDLVFAGFVRACLATLGDTPLEPAMLQDTLRRWHTRATVREQAELAGFGPTPTWYVYRDGRAGVLSEHDWWLHEGVAHVRFGRDGTFSSANAAADVLVELPEGLAGHHWADLVPADARTDTGTWLWDLLETTGVAQSVFDLPLADGRRKVIEYHTTHTPGSDEYESWWRELAIVDVEHEPEPLAVPAA